MSYAINILHCPQKKQVYLAEHIFPSMKKIISVAILISFCTGATLGYAQDTASGSTVSAATSDEKFETMVETFKQRQERVLSTWATKVDSAAQSLSDERSKLASRKEELDMIQQNIDQLETDIVSTGNEIQTLATQIKLINSSIELTKLKIRAVRIQVAEKEQDLFENAEKVDVAEVSVGNQELILGKFLNLIYKQDRLYFSEHANLASDPSLFLSSPSISDIVIRRRYLEALKNTGKDVLRDLQDIQLLLDVKQIQLGSDQEKLNSLKTRLRTEENILEDQGKAKEILLETTKGKEEEFIRLLAESEKEEEDIQKEVDNLQVNVLEIESRILSYKGNIQDSSLSEQQIRDRITQLTAGNTNSVGLLTLQWPVDPARGISAQFQDPSYKQRFGVAHNAVDIPNSQSNPIKAPADGYVVKTKDNGLGYSYIILAHTNGVMTLYGHVSNILVTSGDFVSTGDVIGEVGGRPGTKGAGFMTTGSHLHFEVFQDGKHVNPLLYLDNSKL